MVKPSDEGASRIIRDEHYAEYRADTPPGLSLPVEIEETIAPRRALGDCPDPPGFTVAQEALWLTVLLGQIGWPIARLIGRHIDPLIKRYTFSVDQVRYLIRRDRIANVLQCVVLGARVHDLSAEIAGSNLDALRRRDEDPQLHRVFGRWPRPTEAAIEAWRDAAKAFHAGDLGRTRLNIEERVFWASVMLAQAGWPTPNLMTGFFPLHWVTRKLPFDVVSTLVENEPSFTVIDAVAAGVNIRGLPFHIIDAALPRFEQRIAAVRLQQAMIGTSLEVSTLQSFPELNNAQHRSAIEALVRKMAAVVNNNDKKRQDRLRISDLEVLIATGSLEEDVEQGDWADDDDEFLEEDVQEDQDPSSDGDDEDQETEPQPLVEKDDDDAGVAPAVVRSQAPSSDGSIRQPENSLTPSTYQPPMTAVQQTDLGTDGTAGAGDIDQATIDAVIRRRLGVPTQADVGVMLPSDWELFQPTRLQVLECLGTNRPVSLPTALRHFGHEPLTQKDRENQGKDLDPKLYRSWIGIINIIQHDTVNFKHNLRYLSDEFPPGMRVLTPQWLRVIHIFSERRNRSGILNESRNNIFKKISLELFLYDPYITMNEGLFYYSYSLLIMMDILKCDNLDLIIDSCKDNYVLDVIIKKNIGPFSDLHGLKRQVGALIADQDAVDQEPKIRFTSAPHTNRVNYERISPPFAP